MMGVSRPGPLVQEGLHPEHPSSRVGDSDASWVRGEEMGLKSPLWDPARGVLLAGKQKGSWRYLSHLSHRKPSPRGCPFCSPPLLTLKVLPCSLPLCRLTSATAARLAPNCPPPRSHQGLRPVLSVSTSSPVWETSIPAPTALIVLSLSPTTLYISGR